MSELGNETATAALHLSQKTLDALIQLLKYLLDRDNKRIEREIKQEELQMLKEKNNNIRRNRKLKSRKGRINADKLIKSGEKLIPLKTTMSEENLYKFDEYANRYGVLYTVLGKEKDGTYEIGVAEKSLEAAKHITDKILIVKTKDLENVQDIFEMINEDMKFKAIEEEIVKLENKENKTPEETERLKNLKDEREKLLASSTNDLNKKSVREIFNEVCGKLKTRSISFERSLNRITDRDFSRNSPYYIAERTNPNNYIRLDSSYEEFRGKKYTKTNYRVFNNDVEQRSSLRDDGIFTDERFQGREKYFWFKLRNEMKTKGGFTDDIIIFNSEEEFNTYKSLYIKALSDKSNEKVVENEDGIKDYSNRINSLNERLRSYQMELLNEKVVYSKDKKEVSLDNSSTFKNQYIIANAINIGKQINNYEKLRKIQTKLALSKAALENCNKDEVENINGEILELDKKYKLYSAKATSYEYEAKKLDAIEVEFDVNEKYNNDFDKDVVDKDIDDKDKKDFNSWKDDISENKSNFKTSSKDNSNIRDSAHDERS